MHVDRVSVKRALKTNCIFFARDSAGLGLCPILQLMSYLERKKTPRPPFCRFRQMLLLRRWRRQVQSCQERHAPSVESSVMGLVPSQWFNRLSRRPLQVAGASAQPPTLQLSAWQALDGAAKHYIDYNRWGHTRRPVPENVSSLSNIQLTWSRELDVATKVGLLAHRQSTAVALTGIGASRPSGPSVK